MPDNLLMSLPKWISLLLSEYRYRSRLTFHHLFSPLQASKHDYFDFSKPMQAQPYRPSVLKQKYLDPARHQNA